MGRGAYHAAGTPGPHAMWVVSPSAPSDAVYGLGMITQTAHYHVDLEWTLVVQEAEVAETPATPTPGETPVTIPTAITPVRWHAEQAVREIEGALIVVDDARARLQAARVRLIEQVIAPAYALEGRMPAME